MHHMIPTSREGCTTRGDKNSILIVPTMGEVPQCCNISSPETYLNEIFPTTQSEALWPPWFAIRLFILLPPRVIYPVTHYTRTVVPGVVMEHVEGEDLPAATKIRSTKHTYFAV